MKTLEEGLNGKLILKSGGDVLPWCTCGIGCHICSGSGHGFDATVQEYYNDWRHSPGHYNKTFKEFMEFGGVYDASKLNQTKLERVYLESQK